MWYRDVHGFIPAKQAGARLGSSLRKTRQSVVLLDAFVHWRDPTTHELDAVAQELNALALSAK
jgi:hypothetical protein